jgi:signal transduction histidine kinase
VDLTAFRIVQEALTNITKHSGTDSAHLRLDYSDARLIITVANEGTAAVPAVPKPSRGFGLMGMRERAHSIGGDLHAGPRPDGGYEVTTALPLHPHSAGEKAAGAEERAPQAEEGGEHRDTDAGGHEVPSCPCPCTLHGRIAQHDPAHPLT